MTHTVARSISKGMTQTLSDLTVYEAITLLALRDQKGTLVCGHPRLRIAASVLAQLVLEGLVEVPDRKKPIGVIQSAPSDPILADALAFILEKNLSAKAFIEKQANNRGLVDKIAEQLVDRRILTANEKPVLFFWSTTVYPTVNPAPETRLKDHIRQTLERGRDIDEPTAAVLAIAGYDDLLLRNFDKAWLKGHKARIADLRNDSAIGRALKAIIEELVAVMVITSAAAASVVT